MKSMANNHKFHKKDIEYTVKFLKKLGDDISGKKVLDICGGISRHCNLLSILYD